MSCLIGERKQQQSSLNSSRRKKNKKNIIFCRCLLLSSDSVFISDLIDFCPFTHENTNANVDRHMHIVYAHTWILNSFLFITFKPDCGYGKV
ncbi:hypothetical protein Lalb_Chr02g0155401 [Lupinus albus]|uniref:Uncharacterized protein n=1 Tax=Lupinus albus TaxID=3870 RepID=A0A6A4R0S1_LUPAL|nr:hypothetical protein Lalb_Chr02g0155401 [Lupinus albus]